MKIKVFTLPTCPSCPNAKAIAKEVATEMNVEYAEFDLSNPDGMIEGLMYQIMSTPSIVIDDAVISRGKLVPKVQLLEEVRKRLK